MALAEYFGKNVIAISQLLGGFTSEHLEATLGDVRVGIAFDESSAAKTEGRAILDLLVRLFARFYPKLSIRGTADTRESLIELAMEINPAIEIVQNATVEVALTSEATGDKIYYVGSNEWVASLSQLVPQYIGDSSNRMGAGIAACLAASWVFRSIFLPSEPPETEISFSAYTGERGRDAGPDITGLKVGETVLAGVGAVGNATLWGLHALSGEIHFVDPQRIELSNLQRYVLATRKDESRWKVELANRFLGATWKVHAHPEPWAEFVQTHGHTWNSVVVALDSAKDRRSVQASLPRWIANAWTQLGDLGVSTHDFLGGACLSCLYMPKGQVLSDDESVAQALGVPERFREIRDLLAQDKPASRSLLELIAERLCVDVEALFLFEHRPLRSLYVDGLCGGTILPRSSGAVLDREMQVPLAHQSAMAGILLAAALIKHALNNEIGTTVNRINLMRNIGQHLTQRAQKDLSNSCICGDGDYILAYVNKYDIVDAN